MARKWFLTILSCPDPFAHCSQYKCIRNLVGTDHGEPPFVAILESWTNLVQEPYGYTSDESGFLGACLLLAGMLAAVVTAPLFDRIFTYRLALASKILVPFVGVGWFSLIWGGMSFLRGYLFPG